MNNRLTIQDLADMLAEHTGKDRKNAELFLKEFISLITKGVYTDKIVKVKGLGTFKIILVERRESIHVNTGERFIIPEHYKFSFLPDKELKDLVNKPFSFFETTELNEDVDFSDLEEDSKDGDPEDESIEEILPDKKTAVKEGITGPIEIQGPIGLSGKVEITKQNFQSRDPLTPPEQPVGEISQPKQPDRQEQPFQCDGQSPSKESETRLLVETVFSPVDADAETSSFRMRTPIQESSVQKKHSILQEEKVFSSDTSEESLPQSRGNEIISSDVSDPFAPDSPLDSEERRKPLDLEDENPYEEAPYDEGLDFSDEHRRPSKEGASFKKSVILFFTGAILLLAGIYTYMNKDFVSGLLHGVYVPSIDTTDVSEIYAEAEGVTEEEIRQLTESHSLELPSEYVETDSLGAESDLIETTDTVVVPVSEKSRPQPLSSSPTPDVAAPVTQSNTPQAVPEPRTASSGQPLAVVKIEPGSRLTLISLKYYGNKIFWVYLYEHNKSRIQDPNNVPVGTEIEVPAPELYGIDARSREAIQRASVKQTEIITGK